MSAFPGVLVDAAYHVVSGFAVTLAPLLGGLAAPAAIVLATIAVRLLLLPLSYRAMRGVDARARMALRVQELRRRHAGQPDRLKAELAVLQRSEGTGALTGCLPMLAQWPFLSVMYLLFRSPDVAGTRNTLLTHDLLGAPLGSHWLAGPGPLSAQGAVFAGLILLLAGIGWLSARMARQTATGAQAAGADAGRATAAGPQPGSGTGTAARALSRIAPCLGAVIAAFLPLAAGLYLVTSTAWTLGERALLGRARGRGRDVAPAQPPGHPGGAARPPAG